MSEIPTEAVRLAADAIERANRHPWRGDDRGLYERDAKVALEAVSGAFQAGREAAARSLEAAWWTESKDGPLMGMSPEALLRAATIARGEATGEH